MKNLTSRKHELTFLAQSVYLRKVQSHVYSTVPTPSRSARPPRRRVSGHHPHCPGHQYCIYPACDCVGGWSNHAHLLAPRDNRLFLYREHRSPVLTLCALERRLLHICLSRPGATIRFHDNV